MSKKIIIDNIDVSECENLCRFEDGGCCDRQYEKYASCEGYDCYYKQLKRLQAENERLKSELKSQQMVNLKQQDIALDYWNALEEIREIADEETNTDKLLHYKELRHYKNYCAILDIIQEVLK